MATRLNTRNQTSVRQRIQTTQIVKRLTDHTLGKLKIEMTDSQVRAGLGLLKKTLPDLQSIEHGGSIGGDGGPKRIVLYIPDNGRDPAKPR